MYGTDALSSKIDATGLQSLSFTVNLENVTPAGLDFSPSDVVVADDTIDLDASEIGTGTVGQFTTTTTLPSGLSLLTDYYVIKVSDTQIKVASSLANAVAGTAVNITSQGSGTTTVCFINNGSTSAYTGGDFRSDCVVSGILSIPIDGWDV